MVPETTATLPVTSWTATNLSHAVSSATFCHGLFPPGSQPSLAIHISFLAFSSSLPTRRFRSLYPSPDRLCAAAPDERVMSLRMSEQYDLVFEKHFPDSPLPNETLNPISITRFSASKRDETASPSIVMHSFRARLQDVCGISYSKGTTSEYVSS